MFLNDVKIETGGGGGGEWWLMIDGYLASSYVLCLHQFENSKSV